MALKDGFQAITRAPATFGGQIRDGFSMANHRLQRSAREWATVPAQIPAQVLDRIVEAVRERLDIPSRAEIGELVSRLEAVDKKLAQLEADKAELAAQVEEAKKSKGKPRAAKPKAPDKDKDTAPSAKARSTKSSPRARTATANKTARTKNGTKNGTKSRTKTASKAANATGEGPARKKNSRKKTQA